MADFQRYKLTVEYNPPGFRPVTVTVSANKEKTAEFHGNKLRPLLKEAMEQIEEWQK